MTMNNVKKEILKGAAIVIAGLTIACIVPGYTVKASANHSMHSNAVECEYTGHQATVNR